MSGETLRERAIKAAQNPRVVKVGDKTYRLATHEAAAITDAVLAVVADEILGERIVCPVHGIPDCSALLNGCSRPSLLDGYRTGIANRIARGDS